MQKLKTLVLILSGLILLIPVASAQSKSADDILGRWMNEDKDAHIEIFKRGDKFFGKLVWLKFPIDEETNKPKLDKNNPDEALRSRPTLGLEILTNFEYDDEMWEDGKIYDPKKGRTYSCYMKFLDDDKIKIRGFIGLSLLGRTTYWTRVE